MQNRQSWDIALPPSDRTLWKPLKRHPNGFGRNFPSPHGPAHSRAIGTGRKDPGRPNPFGLPFLPREVSASCGADLVGEIMSKPAGALEELHREHEVAGRLLERLAELGDRIKSGERVDAEAVRFGVGLLDAYLHRVHAPQMDRELRPEAQGVAMPGCFEHLDRMRTNHEEMRDRARELLALIGRWASGDEFRRGAVGDKLIDLAGRDLDTAPYEET